MMKVRLFSVRNMKRSYRSLTGFAACICMSVLCATVVIHVLPTKGEEQIYDQVVRLHVLANSDSDADQALKLRVRDAVLTLLSDKSDAASSADEAEIIYREMLPEIEAAAREVLAAEHSAYDCHVTLTEELYPARTYETYTLPAGMYRSLRVMIGAAEGHNWWCVLFPPLCLSMASEVRVSNDSAEDTAFCVADDAGERMLAAGFTPYEVSLLSDGENRRTVMKFRIVEFFRSLFQK